ncbi:MAG: cell division protein FtsA [Elusimicrobia bacterium]|nr:cell division protein FtsA [Elusimicrobiota bacterium]
MPKPEIIAGLDMGSGRVTCVIGQADPDSGTVTALAGSTVACRGIKGGVVLNIAETARAIQHAVEQAEELAKQDVTGLYLGVRGKHLQSFNNRGAYNIARTDKQITPEDVAAVIDNAKAIPISGDREFLHVIPQSFSLDRQRGVLHPVGMEASLLEVEVHIVTASSSHLNNLIKSVAEAGFEVIEPVYGLLAGGELLLNPEERELGALVIDFGGQSLSVGIFAEGSIKFSKDLDVGSDFITRDLAVGLRTTVTTAEKIKLEHGIAHPKLLNGDDDIRFTGVDGRSHHTVKTSAMLDIILPRVEQIFTAVSDEVSNSNYADLVVPIGAVLTGGGSLLKGMTESAEQILNMPVRLGIPHQGIVTAPDAIMTANYATALGLLKYSLSSSGATPRLGKSRNKSVWLRKIMASFEDLF